MSSYNPDNHDITTFKLDRPKLPAIILVLLLLGYAMYQFMKKPGLSITVMVIGYCMLVGVMIGVVVEKSLRPLCGPAAHKGPERYDELFVPA